MPILQAKLSDLKECTDIIFFSELGKKYYPRRELLEKEMCQGMERDKVYVYKTEDTECGVLGVVWYQPEGIFRSFPYLHMIAVKNGFEHQGIGRALLDFFEADVLKSGNNHIRTKIFLTVGDFNQRAEEIYRQRGYKEICELPDLFRNKITEKLFMKIVSASDERR